MATRRFCCRRAARVLRGKLENGRLLKRLAGEVAERLADAGSLSGCRSDGGKGGEEHTGKQQNTGWDPTNHKSILP
jgi:hypothetical protein